MLFVLFDLTINSICNFKIKKIILIFIETWKFVFHVFARSFQQQKKSPKKVLNRKAPQIFSKESFHATHQA